MRAVDSSQLGGQHNGADEGEEHSKTIEGQDDSGNGDGGNKRSNQSVEGSDPRENGNKNGKVDGGLAGTRGAVVVCDGISNERSDEQGPEELDYAQYIVEKGELHFIWSFWGLKLEKCGTCCDSAMRRDPISGVEILWSVRLSSGVVKLC